MAEYSDEIKAHAQKLRLEGSTYREIQQKLKITIPKGTLSYWVRNITPSPSYFQRLNHQKIQNIVKAQQHNKKQLKKRLNTLKIKNISLTKVINKQVGKLILATLYWCEGSKYPSFRGIKFGNSDPRMIKLFLTLLRLCYPVDEGKFRLTVQCRADQKLTFLSHYWSQVTEIPPPQHYQPRIDKRSVGKETQKTNYKGVCVITYFNTSLQCELQYLGEYLGSDSAIELMKYQIK